MKTFIADIIPKIRQYSQKLDNLTLLTNQHWVVVDELKDSKYVYIFRGNNELLISQNGKVEKGKWEYLGNNSLLIDKKDESYLFRHGFFDDTVLALKIDGKEEFAFLVNENKIGQDVDSIDVILNYLSNKYLNLLPTNNSVIGQSHEVLAYNKSADPSKFGYQVVEISKTHVIGFASSSRIVLKFNNGKTGIIYKGKQRGKYYFIDERDIKHPFPDLERAAKSFYEYFWSH